MKTIVAKTLTAVAILLPAKLYSQGFVNFNFEQATVTQADPPLTSYIYASGAVPGWSCYIGGVPQSIIGYNTVSLGGASIFLTDINSDGLSPLQGAYSVLLEGSWFGTPTAASIGQVGQIPLDAVSLLFYLSLDSNLQVSFDDQIIPLIQIDSTANYVIMGGDISPFAGQTGQLLFTALPNGGYGMFDNIQFSNIPVPEPGTWSLLALGVTLMGFSRLTRRKL